MKLYRIDHGSAAWYTARLGIPTASNFHKIVTPKTGEPSAQAAKYMYRLIAERLLNEPTDDELGYVQWVDHGKAQEPNAVAQFQFNIATRPLEPGGFVTTDDGRLGCSPDRLFPGHKEAVEVKCPAPWTQIQYLLEGPDDNYRPQVQGQMLVGEFDAGHFYSWHPRCPASPKIPLRDVAYQATMRGILERFCDVLDQQTARARAIGAYAVVQRVETPGEIAYQDPGDEQLKIVIPE